MSEQWRPVVGVNGYEVSDMGRVRSVDRVLTRSNGRRLPLTGRVLSPAADSTGHKYVFIGGRQRYLHTLVLEAFVGPRPSGREGCHGNGDPADNRVVNLRWGTRSDNMRDRVRHGVHAQAARTHCPRGHALEEGNLMPSQLRVGKRSCLTCNRAHARRLKETKA